MTALETKLREYQMQVGQWVDRQRMLESQAADAARNAEMIRQRIVGINEAIDLLAEGEPEKQSEVEVRPERGVRIRMRTRSLSGNWQQIMQFVDGGESFDYDELATAAELSGHPVTRDTLRSQMSLYKGSGLIETVGEGKFRLTDAGRKAAGIAVSKEIEPSLGFPEDGSQPAREAQ